MSEPIPKKSKSAYDSVLIRMLFLSIDADYRRINAKKETATRYRKGTDNPARQLIEYYQNLIDYRKLSSNSEFMNKFNKIVELIENYYEI
jgi:hypothetical protein